ncbi:MAG: efflux RND transporter periplasmic adaptor subunit [Verrucomicrobia bacterium]|nr:efflux RND transporter periplasmic adaptor subunit [Verrucomicrobiota bacterium]
MTETHPLAAAQQAPVGDAAGSAIIKPLMTADSSPGASPRPTGPNTEEPRSSGWKMAAMVGLCLLVVAGAVWFSRQKAAAASKTGPGARPMELPPVTVVAGTVALKDVPIYWWGLGTVQAFNTVTVRARVDGQIVKIAFTEGQDVHAGDLLAQIDPDPYHAALQQVAAKKVQDEAQLANARLDLKRYADMLANEGVTQQQYDTQKSLVDTLVATVNADQAAIESAKVLLAYTTITSPIDGRIGLRLVDQGNIVHANDANGLVVITQLRPISVVFMLAGQTLPAIQKQIQGADSELTVLALNQDNTTVLGEGKLAVIDNQIDTTSGQFKLKATFPNTNLLLWPGQFVNARLLLTVRKGCAVVPVSVIQRGPEGTFLFVIKDDQTIEVRPVKVAEVMSVQVNQGEVVVEEGLRAGERVVFEGQYKLQQGSRIKIADATGKTEGRPAATERQRGQNPKAEGSPKAGTPTKSES